MKILFAGYREWSLDVYKALLHVHPYITLVQDEKTLEALARETKWDVIIPVGWSWKIPSDIVNNNIVVGIHPSDLPNYAGGSPIQNQILDGIETTNATLFRFNEEFDKGAIVAKYPISLTGHLSDVLENISCASVILVLEFLDRFPENEYTDQSGTGKKCRRLKPSDSKLPMPTTLKYSHRDDLGNDAFVPEKVYTCKEMWDAIRCREDPYPNVYFEDETGKLTIKLVEFEKKDNSNS